MKRRHIVLFLLILLAALALTPGAQAATVKPTSLTVSAPGYTGDPQTLAQMQVDMIFDMATGTRFNLSATPYPANADTRVTWTSSNRQIATVASSGVVTAHKRGVVTLKATSRSNRSVSDTFVVRIVNSTLPDQIVLSRSSLSLYRFETAQLTALVLPASASKRGIAFKSSQGGVASVSQTGLITAKKAGTAVITCYSTADKTILSTCTVTVSQKANPTSIALTPDTTGLVVGSTLALTAQQYPAAACDQFTWRSSNTRIATVSETGVVTARATGKVTITVTSRQSTRVKATRTLLVVTPDSPLSIKASSDSFILTEGTVTPMGMQAFPLTKSQVFTYRSSRTSVVSVSADGKMTARKAGKAVITVTSAVNRNLSIKVPVEVRQLPAPSSLSITPQVTSLPIGGTVQLSATPFPTGSSPLVNWRTSASRVAGVSSTGLVTARSVGTVTITAVSARSRRVTAVIVLSVYDPGAPTSISLPHTAVSLEPKQTLTLEPSIYPSNAKNGLIFRSSSTGIASVNSRGVITARKSGTTTITVTSASNPMVRASVVVSVVSRATPTRIDLTGASDAMMVGETAILTATPYPASASRLFTFSSSSSSVVSVTQDGKLTARREGTATITVKSQKSGAVRATQTIRVYTDSTPRSISMSTASAFVPQEGTQQLTVSVLPASANHQVTWSTSNGSVATVSSSGVVTGRSAGTATITAKTVKGGLTATCQVMVLSTNLSRVIPARTTDIAGIPENMAKIDALRLSALRQIALERASGKYTASEASLRQQIINRAFAMQAFPWMTLNTQEYWTKAYAYKRYLPGYVYYGMPYIQTSSRGSYLNRRYDVTKALSEQRYLDTKRGYYMLNQNNLLEGTYVGNDCSAFVSMSQWGTAHAASYLNTTAIASSTYYRTVGSYANLRPGDFLVKSGSHVVMFLYYTNSSKTKMMIIEQGGNGNTVICSEFDASHFLSQGYVARRRATFSFN